MASYCSESSEARLRRVEDGAAILRVQFMYGDLIDRLVQSADPAKVDALGDIFTADVILEYDGSLGRIMGLAAAKELFGETLPDRLLWMLHSFSNPIIDIDNRSARGRWVVYALTVDKTRDSEAPEVVYGRYAAEYRRTDRGWRISTLRFMNETRPASASGRRADMVITPTLDN
jgi:hypothetical protein